MIKKACRKRTIPRIAAQPRALLDRDFVEFMHRLFSGAHRGMSKMEFFKSAVIKVSAFSRCDEAELWVEDRGKTLRAFYNAEMTPSFTLEVIKPGDDEKKYDRAGKIFSLREVSLNLSRKCGEPPYALFLKKRGVWISRNAELFNGTVVIVPIPADHESIGHIVLRSKSGRWLSEYMYRIYKEMAYIVGVALTYRRAQVHLRERVKELTCLYGISRIFKDTDLPINDVIGKVLNEIPPAWLYPEITRASIVLDGRCYGASSDERRISMQQAPLLMSGEVRGMLEVFYNEVRPELDEGPFLHEERHLVNTIARELEILLEHIYVEKDRTKVQEQLRHADRLATIGQLAAGVAHEINEPLASILGFAQLARQDDATPPAVKRDLEKIVNSSLHARDIVKKLLVFARQAPPQKSEVSVNDIVDEAIQFCHPRCAKMGIEVILQCSSALPSIVADRGQLHQVLINLMVNAIQAMESGGKLSITTSLHNDDIVVKVQDTGTGMSEEIQSRIFMPFFTTKDVNEGTGLGLSVVHGIVTSHGGSITVESRPQKGSTFTVILPLTLQQRDER
ncbi:MAG: sensor histidine kinase [Candidatus Xenobiia bacterium LiM19]